MTWAVKRRIIQARIKIIIWALPKHSAPIPTHKSIPRLQRQMETSHPLIDHSCDAGWRTSNEDFCSLVTALQPINHPQKVIRSGEITASKHLRKSWKKTNSGKYFTLLLLIINELFLNSASKAGIRVPKGRSGFRLVLHWRSGHKRTLKCFSCWISMVGLGWERHQTGLKPAGTIPVAAIPYQSPHHFHFYPWPTTLPSCSSSE